MSPATSKGVSEKQSDENTLLVDGDDELSEADPDPEPEQECAENEPDASGGVRRHYLSRVHRPPNRYEQ